MRVMPATNTRRRSDNRCFPLFVQYNSPEHPEPSGLCSVCNLRTYQALLDSPLGYREAVADIYSSLTSSYVDIITSLCYLPIEESPLTAEWFVSLRPGAR